MEPDIEDNKKIMPPSRRTGAARPVAKQAPPPARPSIPASTQSRAGAVPPPPAGRPAGAPPPAMAPAAAAPPMMGGGGGGGMLSGLGGMVMQGMAMGTGSAIAHRAVDSVMGPRQVEHVHNGQEAPAPAAGAAPHAMSGMLPRPRVQRRTHSERSRRCCFFCCFTLVRPGCNCWAERLAICSRLPRGVRVSPGVRPWGLKAFAPSLTSAWVLVQPAAHASTRPICFSSV